MKKLLLFALSASLLSACSSGSDEDIQKEDPPVAIILSAKSLTIDVKTKAPYTLTTPGPDEDALTARVISSLTAGDYTDRHSNGTMTFISDERTSYNTGATDPYYPANDGLLYFSGFYPAEGWTASPTTTAAFTFNGSHDVMYAGEPSSQKSTANTAPALTFNHLLTLLNVYLVADGDDAKAAWGDITKIELIKAKEVDACKTVIVTMGATPGVAFTTAAAIPFYLTGTDNAVSSDEDEFITLPTTAPATASAYAMVESITVNEKADYTLKVYSTTFAAGREVAINLKNSAGNADFEGSTQGKSFNVTLTFRTTAITATASVTAWAESGKAEEDVK